MKWNKKLLAMWRKVFSAIFIVFYINTSLGLYIVYTILILLLINIFLV